MAAEAGTDETRLPTDPAAADLMALGADVVGIVAQHPTSSLGWAMLAEAALRSGSQADVIAGYAYARTGYHRGLDTLRRAGWHGTGEVPWEHEPNRGFLRALWALSVAAGRIGETDEQQRCAQFLRDSSETGYHQLADDS
jgi:hypothetical protein